MGNNPEDKTMSDEALKKMIEESEKALKISAEALRRLVLLRGEK